MTTPSATFRKFDFASIKNSNCICILGNSKVRFKTLSRILREYNIKKTQIHTTEELKTVYSKIFSDFYITDHFNKEAINYLLKRQKELSRKACLVLDVCLEDDPKQLNLLKNY